MYNNELSIELKSISDEPGSFAGRLSTYGNLDETGDICEQGCFTKTLRESGGTIPLFLNHNRDSQLGVLVLRDSPEALSAQGKLNMNLPIAKDVYSNLKFNEQYGIKTGLSIGFRTIKDKMEGSVRHLVELALGEGSLTLWPANQQALVTAVKTADDARQKQAVVDAIQHLRAILRRGIADIEERSKTFQGRK